MGEEEVRKASTIELLNTVIGKCCIISNDTKGCNSPEESEGVESSTQTEGSEVPRTEESEEDGRGRGEESFYY